MVDYLSICWILWRRGGLLVDLCKLCVCVFVGVELWSVVICVCCVVFLFCEFWFFVGYGVDLEFYMLSGVVRSFYFGGWMIFCFFWLNNELWEDFFVILFWSKFLLWVCGRRWWGLGFECWVERGVIDFGL